MILRDRALSAAEPAERDAGDERESEPYANRVLKERGVPELKSIRIKLHHATETQIKAQ